MYPLEKIVQRNTIAANKHNDARYHACHVATQKALDRRELFATSPGITVARIVDELIEEGYLVPVKGRG